MRKLLNVLLAALVVAVFVSCDKGDETPVTGITGVPQIADDCSMLRVKVRTYLGQNGGAEVARWAVDAEPEIRIEPLNTKGNPLPSSCGWNGAAAVDLVTPGMECSTKGDPESASRYLKCDKRGSGRIVGKVLVNGVLWQGSWDISVI
jgi:hypothetical protein